jgi:hypothetical protein
MRTLAQQRPVHHPLFARVYARVGHLMDAEIADHRRRLLATLTGRVLEVGAGNGLNFPHYPAAVTEVLAVEPEPSLRRLGLAVARQAPVPDSAPIWWSPIVLTYRPTDIYPTGDT